MQRWFLLIVGVVSLPGLVWAQQAPLSCEQSLREAEYRTNAERLVNRTMQDAFARELRVAVERAEKAEQALTLAKDAKDAKAPAPPVGEPGK